MTALDDLAAFLHSHGPLTGDATEPAWNGYLLTVTCPCRVVFERWVMPVDAELDMLHSSSLATPASRTNWGAQSLGVSHSYWAACAPLAWHRGRSKAVGIGS